MAILAYYGDLPARSPATWPTCSPKIVNCGGAMTLIILVIFGIVRST
ncbi:MAG: hypothetical protein ACR2M0_13065 [Chloroflexia bacterium]